MKRLLLLPLILVVLVLTGCERESGVDRSKQIYLTLHIKAPSSGAMTLATDLLAIQDEARINRLAILVFGPAIDNPQTTDDYLLEGIFPASGDATAALTTGSAITITEAYAQGANKKHIFFVANVDLTVTHQKTTETELLQMLSGPLPKIDNTTPGDLGTPLTVTGLGIPMSAFASVDLSDPDVVDTPVNVTLQRAVARFDVVNTTNTYRVIDAYMTANDRGLIFDTTGMRLTLPAGTFRLDYPAGAGMAAYDTVKREVSPVADIGDVAVPVAMGYIWPSPASSVNPVFVTLRYQEVDTDPSSSGLQPGPVQSAQIRFVRGNGTIFDTVKRNHVYRITIMSVDNEASGSFEIEDWQTASADIGAGIHLAKKVDFLAGAPDDANGKFSQSGGQNFFTTSNNVGTKGTFYINTSRQTPAIATTTSAIPSWLRLGGQTGQVPTADIFTAVDTLSSVSVEILEANTSRINDQEYVLYVTLDGVQSAPTSSIKIILPHQ